MQTSLRDNEELSAGRERATCWRGFLPLNSRRITRLELYHSTLGARAFKTCIESNNEEEAEGSLPVQAVEIGAGKDVHPNRHRLRLLRPNLVSHVFFFFFALFTGPRSSMGLKLSDTRVYEPQIRAHLVAMSAMFAA